MGDEENSEIAWFRVADMNVEGNETWMTNGGLRFTQATWERLGLKAIPAGSIIFPKRGGAIATNKKRRLRFSAGCDLNIMAVSPSRAIANFLWTWFQTLNLAKLSDGSNVPQINNPDIAPLTVPLPPEKEQSIIVESVEDQLSVIDHLEADLEAKMRAAESLRQSVYRHAFTGQLVPQDPNDEPASELLKRVAEERAARITKKAHPRQPAIRRQKRQKREK
jgi:type I restriction enzyme S subunit